MARGDNEVRVMPSVLDRLIDYEPEVSREPAASRSKSVRQLKQSVKRDLEWLLNTRQVALELSPELREVNDSLAAYGFPDFSTININDPESRKRLLRSIEAAISVFEPRLDNVIITFEPMQDNQRMMRFRIDAHLKVEPAPEPVAFDTKFFLNSGQYVVRED
jgi:type VI secretion system protein ImpF